MSPRTLAVLLVVLALVSLSSRLTANPADYQTYSGVFESASNCPDADYALVTFCTHEPFMYVVFKGKGAKRLAGQRVFIQGTPLQTTCGLPAVEMKKVKIDDSPLPGCPD